MFICSFLNLIYIFSKMLAQSVFVLHELCKKTKAPKTNCLRQSYFLTGEIFYVYSNLFSASAYKYNLAQLRKFFIDLHIFDVFVFLCSTDRKRFHIVLIFVTPRKFLYHIVRNQYIYSQIDQHKTVFSSGIHQQINIFVRNTFMILVLFSRLFQSLPNVYVRKSSIVFIQLNEHA